MSSETIQQASKEESLQPSPLKAGLPMMESSFSGTGKEFGDSGSRQEDRDVESRHLSTSDSVTLSTSHSHDDDTHDDGNPQALGFLPSRTDPDEETASLSSTNNCESQVGTRSIQICAEQEEIMVSSENKQEDGTDDVPFLFTWSNPWLPATFVSLGLVAPLITANIFICLEAFGKLWTATPLILHLFWCLAVTRCFLLEEETLARIPFRILTSAAALMDIFFFIVVYPVVWNVIADIFFTDVDGTDVIEWTHYKHKARIVRILGIVISSLRVGLAIIATFARFVGQRMIYVDFCDQYGSLRAFKWRWTWISSTRKARIRITIVWLLYSLLFLSGFCLIWSIISLTRHVIPVSAPEATGDCDPLDETECSFPFPSFHHMRPDSTTATGWRVHLQPDVLPPLKARKTMKTDALNELDGFSTLAPILFYMDGLKEAHEAGVDQLHGLSNIAQSVTWQSATLLVDIDAKILVAHSAEIDYIDRDHPSVMVFPAAPLKHNTHYALAVVNATDAFGKRLDPTRGMLRLLEDDNHKSNPRRARYVDTLIPALTDAAEWFSYSADPHSLQLMFDFQTISEESQLGTVRAVRDGVIAQVDSKDEWSWEEHVRTVRIDDHNCEDGYTARTVHGELDVPWFLEAYGSGHRAALMDRTAVQAGRSRRLGVAKFVVKIPCSVRNAALGLRGGRSIRAVMEYGHGLMYSRNEASDSALNRVADKQGYVIVAMDWRGMSLYDLPAYAKILLSEPSLLEAVRDNVIQGYANKYALQHFVKNSMMSMDWFSFLADDEKGALQPAITQEEDELTQVFYGNSLGGILGGGYVTLSGATGLIDRAILGVPGASFSMIMSRSVEVSLFNVLAKLNIYTGRHLRIMTSMMQMALDCIEGAGVLAEPVSEPYPPILLQTGLGDVSVPATSAEVLARGFHASTLANHPISVYGVPVAEQIKGATNGSQVTLTELLYVKEHAEVPVDNTTPKPNGVHVCVRVDSSMNEQMIEFINWGQVSNPCRESNNGCIREEADCGYWENQAEFFGSFMA